MAAGKNPYLRYRIIHACLSSRRKRYWTKVELIARLAAHDFKVSLRTLGYDIANMQESEELGYMAPIEYCPTQKGYYYTDPNYTIDAIPFTVKELPALSFASTILQKYHGVELVSQFEAAFHKVSKVMSQMVSSPSKKKPVIAFEKAPYYKGLQYFDLIHQSTEDEQPLRIAYRKFEGDKEDVHVFHPYCVKEYEGRLSVIGYSELRKHILTFGLDRMENVVEEKIPFRTNVEVDPDTYFDHTLGVKLTNGKVENIELQFSVMQGHYVKTKHLHRSQEIVRDDAEGLVISLQLIPNYELTSLILGYGLDVMVLKPLSLQRKIKEVFEKGREVYGSGV